MATDMQRTNIYLSDQDRAAIERIKAANGLTTTSAAVRMALRQLDRQMRANERRRPTPGGESEGR